MMYTRNFLDLLKTQWKQNKFLCVGLDIDLKDFPSQLISSDNKSRNSILLLLSKNIIDATKEVVCAYKLNLAFFYEEECKHNTTKHSTLKTIIEYIKEVAPSVPIILDAKWGDIENTNIKYASMAFDSLGVDAITVSPYVGGKALEPFLQNSNKGIFVLCRTSNPGSSEFQTTLVGKQHLFHYVAQQVAKNWNEHGNCGIVVGATFPESISEVRQIVGDVPILIPGVGAQGGELKSAIRCGMDNNREGILIATSRAIIHDTSHNDYVTAVQKKAMKLHKSINQYRHTSD